MRGPHTQESGIGLFIFLLVTAIPLLPIMAYASPLICEFLLVRGGQATGACICCVSPSLPFASMSFDPSKVFQQGAALTQSDDQDKSQRADLLRMVGQRPQGLPRAPTLANSEDSAVYLQFFCAALEFALFLHAAPHPYATASRCATKSTSSQWVVHQVRKCMQNPTW